MIKMLAPLTLASCLALLVPAPAAAQGLPPIYDGLPRQIQKATTVAEFPKGTFLENIAIGPRGDFFVTSYLEGKIYRITDKGSSETWAQLDGTIAGIALNPDGSALVSGWHKGKVPALFMVEADGQGRLLMNLEGGQFPNGVVRLGPGQYLVADSYRGVIWSVDSAARKAGIWLDHPMLARRVADDPTPAANGLKLRGDQLYVSNTSKQILVRVPVVAGKAGAPELVSAQLGLDDFDFDSGGTLYGATHVYNSLVRVSPGGKVSVLAELPQGMAGNTAVAVVERPGQAPTLWVTTNGGMSMPPAGGVQPARLVRVEVDAAK